MFKTIFNEHLSLVLRLAREKRSKFYKFQFKQLFSCIQAWGQLLNARQWMNERSTFPLRTSAASRVCTNFKWNALLVMNFHRLIVFFSNLFTYWPNEIDINTVECCLLVDAAKMSCFLKRYSIYNLTNPTWVASFLSLWVHVSSSIPLDVCETFGSW